jgi:hypothetical protein
MAATYIISWNNQKHTTKISLYQFKLLSVLGLQLPGLKSSNGPDDTSLKAIVSMGELVEQIEGFLSTLKQNKDCLDYSLKVDRGYCPVLTSEIKGEKIKMVGDIGSCKMYKGVITPYPNESWEEEQSLNVGEIIITDYFTVEVVAKKIKIRPLIKFFEKVLKDISTLNTNTPITITLG